MYKRLHDKTKIISESDHEIPQSCIADQPVKCEEKQ